MIITIYKGNDTHHILLGSKDQRFHALWGNVVQVPNSLVYQNLSEIASWVNNELNEECLFEID